MFCTFILKLRIKCKGGGGSQIFKTFVILDNTTTTNDVECYCTLYKIIIQPCKKENMLRCVKFMQDSLKTFVLIKEHSEWIYYEK